MFRSINPYTQEIIFQTQSLSDKKLEVRLNQALEAFSQRCLTPAVKTGFYLQELQNLVTILDQQKPHLARWITQEMGKPITQSLAEIEKCILLCQYVKEQAPRFLATQHQLVSAPPHSYVTYQPLGVILGIMPWNFPFWQVFRFAIPTLVGGNAVLVKHAPNVGGCAEQIEMIIQQAGFPKGVYQNLPISIEQTAQVIRDKRVRGVSLTGSVRAGRAVAGLAGQYLKKVVLELGGNDPYLVLDSADCQHSAIECVRSRMNNSGQSCIASKRWIVTQKKAMAFTKKVLEHMQAYSFGDPLLPETNLGPLARQDLQIALQEQVQKLIKGGAKLLLGGSMPSTKGFFYSPTVLSCEGSTASGFDEELFGPVALIVTVANEEEAIQQANNSGYGLGGAVFSTDIEKAKHIASRRLQTGAVAINQALHSHPGLPFGGVKDSGYGRELSQWGFYEFMNIKTIFNGS